jgi:hypothetical protein
MDRAVNGRLDSDGTVVEPPVIADCFHFMTGGEVSE